MKAPVPWKDMETGNPDDFIDPIYLPEGIQLTQYHHLHVADCDKMLLHWTNRKAAGEVVFRFKSTARATYHAKKALARAGEGTVEEGEDIPEYDGEKSSDEETAKFSEEDDAGNDRSVSWLLKLDGRY
jgi:hypothetical protein